MMKRIRAFLLMERTAFIVLAVNFSIFVMTEVLVINSWKTDLFELALVVAIVTVTSMISFSFALLRILFMLACVMANDAARRKLNSAIIYLGYIDKNDVKDSQYHYSYLQKLRERKKVKIL